MAWTEYVCSTHKKRKILLPAWSLATSGAFCRSALVCPPKPNLEFEHGDWTARHPRMTAANVPLQSFAAVQSSLWTVFVAQGMPGGGRSGQCFVVVRRVFRCRWRMAIRWQLLGRESLVGGDLASCGWTPRRNRSLAAGDGELFGAPRAVFARCRCQQSMFSSEGKNRGGKLAMNTSVLIQLGLACFVAKRCVEPFFGVKLLAALGAGGHRIRLLGTA